MEKAKPIRVFSSKELAREIQQINDSLSNIENNWSSRISAMKRLEGLVLGGALQFENFHPLLKSSIIPLTLQLSDRRSSIIKQVCHLIGFLAEELTNAFEFAVEIFIPALLKLVIITVQIIAETTDQCTKKLITHCKITRLLPVLIDTATKDKNPTLRIRCSSYVLLILRQWQHTNELQKNPELYAVCIKRCVGDALAEVRLNGRLCFLEFSNIWSERSKKLFASFDYSVQKLILEESSKNPSTANFKFDPNSQKNYNHTILVSNFSNSVHDSNANHKEEEGEKGEGEGGEEGEYEKLHIKIIKNRNLTYDEPYVQKNGDGDKNKKKNSVNDAEIGFFVLGTREEGKETVNGNGKFNETSTVKMEEEDNIVNVNGGNDVHYIHSNGGNAYEEGMNDIRVDDAKPLEEKLPRKSNGLLEFFSMGGVFSNLKNKNRENENKISEDLMKKDMKVENEDGMDPSPPIPPASPSPSPSPPSPPPSSLPQKMELGEERTDADVSENPNLTSKSNQSQSPKSDSEFKIKSKLHSELEFKSELEFEIGEGLNAANAMLNFTAAAQFLAQIKRSISTFLSQLKSNQIEKAAGIFSSVSKLMPPFLSTLHLTDDVEKSNVLHEFLNLGIRVKVVMDDIVSIGGSNDPQSHSMSRGTYTIFSLLTEEAMDTGKVVILWERRENKSKNSNNIVNNNINNDSNNNNLSNDNDDDDDAKLWCLQWCMWNSDLPVNSSSFLLPISSPLSNPPFSPPRPSISPRLSPRPSPPSHSPRFSHSSSRRLSSPLPPSFASSIPSSSPDPTRKKLSHSSPEFWGYVPDSRKHSSFKSSASFSIPRTAINGVNHVSVAEKKKLSRSCSSSPLGSTPPPPQPSSPTLNMARIKSQSARHRRSLPSDLSSVPSSIPNFASYFSQNNSNPAEVWLVS